MKDKASMFELQNVYNYRDACKLHAMIDMQEDYEAYDRYKNRNK